MYYHNFSVGKQDLFLKIVLSYVFSCSVTGGECSIVSEEEMAFFR